ncbi:MAG: hypothetical protein J0I12_04400 [Candidatus Eremiobacteraeota bacterium]|nr:hypothetical protein [Candidatus Eremiobacteraeota bacterium]
MQEAHSARVIAFPSQAPAAEAPPSRSRPECRITTAPSCFQGSYAELSARCQQLVRSFEKKHGFTLPALVFEDDPELNQDEWVLSMRGCELHQGKLSGDPMESISRELLGRAWKLFTYESFRTRLKELEEWEPFLAQEVSTRLDLVLTWQALQSLLKNGGSLHRFSAKLERILVEADGRSREQLLSPRMLSVLQQT